MQYKFHSLKPPRNCTCFCHTPKVGDVKLSAQQKSSPPCSCSSIPYSFPFYQPGNNDSSVRACVLIIYSSLPSRTSRNFIFLVPHQLRFSVIMHGDLERGASSWVIVGGVSMDLTTIHAASWVALSVINLCHRSIHLQMMWRTPMKDPIIFRCEHVLLEIVRKDNRSSWLAQYS